MHGILNSPNGQRFMIKLRNGEIQNLKEQRKLVEIIVDFIVDRNVKLPRNALKEIATQITMIFPNQHPEFYYDDTLPKPKGLLYNRYNNMRTLNKKESGIKRKRSEDAVNEDTQTLLTKAEEDADEFCRANAEGEMSEFFPMWRISNSIRKSLIGMKNMTLLQIFETYKALKRNDGYLLVILIS